MLKKIQKIVLYVLVIYAIFGFLVLPFILKSQLIKIVQEQSHSKLSLESIYFNPFLFKLKISGIELSTLDNKHLVSLKSLLINLEPNSLVNSAIHIKNFVLEKPEITLVYNKDKSINFTKIFKQSSEVSQEKEREEQANIPRVILDKIKINRGIVNYKDFSNKSKFDFTFHNIGFELNNIDTKELKSSNAKLRFYSSLGDGGFVDFKTDIVGLKPLIVNGSLDFKASKLYTQWRYMKDKLNLEVADGKLSFYADYHLNLDDLNATTINNLRFSLNNLRVKPKNRYKDVLTLKSFSVTDTTIKPFVQQINIKSIGLNSLYAKATMSNNGKLDWLEYIKVKAKASKIDKSVPKEESSSAWKVDIESVGLENIKLDFNDNSAKKLLDFESFDVKNFSLNTKTKEIILEDMALNGLNIYTKRFKDGHLNVQDLLIPHAKTNNIKKVTKTKDKKEKRYKVLLKHFALNMATLNFRDEYLRPSVKSKIDKITLNAYDISSQKNSFLKYDLSLRVNSKGYLKSSGTLKHTPLEQNGVLSLENISLKELTPYLHESTYLNINKGFVSLKSKTKYKKSKKSSDLNIDGSLKVEKFFLADSRDKSLLLSLGKLNLNDFSFRMFPNRLFISEANINSFYVNALVKKDKSMNFASLVKKKRVVKALQREKSKKKKQEKFPMKIMKLSITKSGAKFADESIPLNFKTNIHDINGVAYLISNNDIEISYFNINGEIDRYGATNLMGSITLGNPKSYMDMNLNFDNLALNSLSGYSASFAGYKIDNGKLFLDLGYNIIDSNLSATNSVMIKNIELGDKFEDANSSLPLGLAIGLLEDSSGVIDIDLPIKGNLDEPDFKYGAIVFKAVVNLIVKAVASPFKFLASMIGIGSDDLEYISFNNGEYIIRAPEREKLDSVVKMMKKRPKLSLIIHATYDEELDKKALQYKKLMKLVMKKSSKDSKSMLTTDLLETIYKEVNTKESIEKIKNSLKNKYKDEVFEREYTKVLLDECIKIQKVLEGEMKELALKRGGAIKDYLLSQKSINIKRIKDGDISTVDEKDNKIVKTKLEVEVGK